MSGLVEKHLPATAISVFIVFLFIVSAFALPVQAGPPKVARGLDLVGATDFELDTPTRNTEIEVRGDFVYIGSYFPADEEGRTAFKVVDVSEPSSPVLAMQFFLPGTVRDTQVNNDVDRCGYGRTLKGLDDPACNTVLATTQNAPGQHGAWLFDVRDPAHAMPWGWDSSRAYEDQVAFILFASRGSHNGFLFGDLAFIAGIGESSFDIWDISPLFGDPPAPPERVAWYSNLDDPRPIRPDRERLRSHDIFVQRSPDGRVFAYVPGPQIYIVDVTDVVDGSTTGDISDHLVAYNNYIDADGTVKVARTTGSNGHHTEATDDGSFTYVGDERGCGEPGIIHIFDSRDLPAVGDTPKELVEVGIISWPTSSASQCNERHADGHPPDRQNRNGNTDTYARTGHNFRIYGEIMTHGVYSEGVYVWDLSDPANPVLVAQFKGVRNHDGKAAEKEVFSKHLTLPSCGRPSRTETPTPCCEGSSTSTHPTSSTASTCCE